MSERKRKYSKDYSSRWLARLSGVCLSCHADWLIGTSKWNIRIGRVHIRPMSARCQSRMFTFSFALQSDNILLYLKYATVNGQSDPSREIMERQNRRKSNHVQFFITQIEGRSSPKFGQKSARNYDFLNFFRAQKLLIVKRAARFTPLTQFWSIWKFWVEDVSEPYHY